MSPETQAFLDRVRDAEDPSAEVEQRVLLALDAAGAGGAVSASAWGTSKVAKLLTGGGASGWKLCTLGLCLLGATSAVIWPHDEAHSPRPVPVVLAPPEPESEPVSAPLPALSPPPTALEPPKIRAVPARAPASAASAPAPRLRDELSLLSRVQVALQRGEGSEALRLLDEHHTSDRQLSAERAAARVLALCAAGQAAQARSAAAAFLREHPGSVQTSAVARACAGKEQP